MLIKNGTNQFNGSTKCTLVSSAVLRGQRFLISSLGRYSIGNRMQETKAASGNNLEADAYGILRAITPTMYLSRHKRQAGKIAVIGGCREYTGAPYFAANLALKIGADLSHVFCTKDAAPVVNSYSPELILHPILEESYNGRERKYISGKVVAEVEKWMQRFDCLDCVSEIMKQVRKLNVPTVIDGICISDETYVFDDRDGLFLVTNSIDLVSGYPLAVLTPNVNEHKRLVEKVLNSEVNDQNAHEQLLCLAKRIGGVTILRKGKSDLISDDRYGPTSAIKSVSIDGSPRRCGGQGDILSGSVAVFLSWARQRISAAEGNLTNSPTNPTVLGCIAGSALLRRAASLALEDGKRTTLTTDIIEHLGRSLENISQIC